MSDELEASLAVARAIRRAERFELRNRVIMFVIGIVLVATGYFFSASGDGVSTKELLMRALLVVALMLALTAKLILYKVGRNTRLLLQAIGVVQRHIGISKN